MDTDRCTGRQVFRNWRRNPGTQELEPAMTAWSRSLKLDSEHAAEQVSIEIRFEFDSTSRTKMRLKGSGVDRLSFQQ